MNDPARQWHPYRRAQAEDLQILADGGETGWWDDTGTPAPWPEDFLDPAAGWANQNAAEPGDNRADDDPKNPPF